jgi:endonuclease-8
MPEGDTIFRAAQTLDRALAGKRVVRFDSALPALKRVNDDRPLAGRTIESVSSRGKHLLIVFSGDLVLHTHMRMNGTWHIYRPGERWQRPLRDMRVLVATEEFVAVGFNVPVAEFLTARDMERHPQLRTLGPDLLDASFDRDGARQRMRARAAEPIADVLLDQRVVAGAGNVFKSEILFAAGIDPFAPVSALSDADLLRVLDLAVKQLRVNVADRTRSLAPAAGRRTTGSLSPSKGLWVYGRGGLPCRKCGAAIQSRKTGIDARLTYWCPVCQAPGFGLQAPATAGT